MSPIRVDGDSMNPTLKDGDIMLLNELSKDYLHLKNLEFSIDWLGRRISFLRELIRTKRTIMESKQ